MGWDPISPLRKHAGAAAVARLLSMFPALEIIAAHMGGLKDYDEAEAALAGRRVWLDTSMASRYCSRDQFARMIRKHGPERVLFATDCPWSRAEDALNMLESVPLIPEEKEMICSGNAKRLLKLSLGDAD